MSWFGAIRSVALKVLQPTNRNIVPNISSNRLLANRFDRSLDDIKKDLPLKPKRPLSGYNVFFQEMTSKLKAQNPEIHIKDLAKTIGSQWKSLDPISRQEINDKTRDEQQEYNKLVKDWKNSLTEEQRKAISTSNRTRRALNVRRRIKSELKRLEYPTRNVSAFNFYVKENIISREKTSQPYKDVFKLYATKWKSMSDDQKKPYIEAAKTDKMRYLNEVEVWKQKMTRPENKSTLDNLFKMKAFVSDRLGKEKIEKPKKLRLIKKIAKKAKKLAKAKKVTKTAKKESAKAKTANKSSKPKENREN